MDILILHDNIPDSATPDVLDVITQVKAVKNALDELGYNSTIKSIPDNLNILEKQLENDKPSLVVNLVEAINGSAKLAYKIPEMLEKLNIFFTGTNSKAMLTTTDKLLTKSILKANDILTPKWITADDDSFESGTYILKPVNEDASVGVDEGSVVHIVDRVEFLDKVKNNLNSDWFAESYIDGREWNVGILGTKHKIEILPPAEIRFINYDENKPKVLGYQAKWVSDSFEYQNTNRHFDHSPNDVDLIAKLESIAERCWFLFELSGYARVDFRVDSMGIPYVLEINANPCIAPDAGLVAAASQKGINYTSMIKIILAAAVNTKNIL